MSKKVTPYSPIIPAGHGDKKNQIWGTIDVKTELEYLL